jgi:glycosyltransferase involved in cell wall biosynthesis
VPNPEWFDRHDLRLLSHIDRIWAKTTNTQQIFQRLKCDTSLIEFDSEDRFDPAAPRQLSFFHLAGKSTMKGTARLLKLWQAHPQWPTLTVVQHASADQPAPAGNIDYRSEYLDDVELRRLQNGSLFHLCPSETEGWGHYLVEAMSVGAIAITLDAPPMNELVTAERGLLIAAHKSRMQKLAQCFEFDEASCVAAIERAIAMKDQEIAELSTAARQWFLSNKMGFRQRVKNALTALPGQS